MLMRATSRARNDRGCSDSHHGNGIAIEGAALPERLLREGIEDRHHLIGPAKGAAGESAAHDLGKRRDIGIDLVVPLHPAVSEPEGHDFVEHQQRAVRFRQRAQGAQEFRFRGNHACGTHHRFDDDRGNLVAAFREDPFRGRHVIERDDRDRLQAVLGHTQCVDGGNRRPIRPGIDRRMHAHFEIVEGAVVAALHFDDQLAAGKRAGAADGHHGRFCSGIGEAHLVDRRNPPGKPFGQIGLRLQRSGIVRAERQLRGHRLGDRLEGMTVNERGVIVQQVDIGVAIQIGEGIALALHDRQRIGRVEGDVRVSPPGIDRLARSYALADAGV